MDKRDKIIIVSSIGLIALAIGYGIYKINWVNKYKEQVSKII